MFKKPAILFSTMAILSTQTHAIGYSMDTNKVLPIKVSSEGPTRFSIDQEKIADVFFYPDLEDGAKVTLHKTGHVFLTPPQELKPEHNKLYLTLISDCGHTQDLRLNFSKMAPEPVEIKHAKH